MSLSVVLRDSAPWAALLASTARRLAPLQAAGERVGHLQSRAAALRSGEVDAFVSKRGQASRIASRGRIQSYEACSHLGSTSTTRPTGRAPALSRCQGPPSGDACGAAKRLRLTGLSAVRSDRTLEECTTTVLPWHVVALKVAVMPCSKPRLRGSRVY